MFRNACYDRQNEMNNEFNADNMNVDIDVQMGDNNVMNSGMGMAPAATTQGPVMEPMRERQVHRTIMHEVQQV